VVESISPGTSKDGFTNWFNGAWPALLEPRKGVGYCEDGRVSTCIYSFRYSSSLQLTLVTHEKKMTNETKLIKLKFIFKFYKKKINSQV